MDRVRAALAEVARIEEIKEAAVKKLTQKNAELEAETLLKEEAICAAIAPLEGEPRSPRPV